MHPFIAILRLLFLVYTKKDPILKSFLKKANSTITNCCVEIVFLNNTEKNMRIKSIFADTIFDSRGTKTISCCLQLEDGYRAIASVPSGISRGTKEAHSISPEVAADLIAKKIGPLLLQKDFNTQKELDQFLIEMDGTKEKSNLGGNTILAMSIAFFKALAHTKNKEPFESIADFFGSKNVPSFPRLCLNMINGGAHKANTVALQEIMVSSMAPISITEQLDSLFSLFYTLETCLNKSGHFFGYGHEGGIVCQFESEEKALDILMESITLQPKEIQKDFVILLDCAATQFFDISQNRYLIQKKKLDCEALISWYQSLITTYPIISIEDGIAESDEQGWKALYQQLCKKIHIIGDDLFCTNKDQIEAGFLNKLATGALIKPNQIGTVTETFDAINTCKKNNGTFMVSHRSHETNDTFIADLAVGSGAPYFKSGCLGGERISKYNRLIEIEKMIRASLIDKASYSKNYPI